MLSELHLTTKFDNLEKIKALEVTERSNVNQVKN